MRWNNLRLFFFVLFPVFVASCLLVFLVLESFMTNASSNLPKATSMISNVLPQATPTDIPLPISHTIPSRLHVFQSFNNCGPATLSMALSYVGVEKTQAELGQVLRPYQITGGDNDDKSVTLVEVANQAEKYGLLTYLRPNGDIEKLKKFIANNIPVITRTWLKKDEDIGHYRVIRGYDDKRGVIIQDDSLQGKDLTYTYSDFDQLWQTFNYEYLVIVKEEEKETVEGILGEELNEQRAWENALTRVNQLLGNNPDNIHLKFARSRIYYYLKDYEKSVDDFDEVENKLSFRTLWYQIEPLLSIYETGDNERVLIVSDNILRNQNRAYSELYILRGKVFQRYGNETRANEEFQLALRYNENLEEAKRLTLNNTGQ